MQKSYSKEMMLKPIVKYQGGKSKELKIIQGYNLENYSRIIEPFCGGAAVSFHYGKPSLLSDVNWNVINLYKTVADETMYQKLQDKVDETKLLEHDDLEKLFYKSRDCINEEWATNEHNIDLAFAYIIVRQLCFSGMERYCKKGKFNVPFGHYKHFACNLERGHHDFLNTCIIKYEDAIDCLFNVQPGDFMFLDPPYLDRLGYSSGMGRNDLHEELAIFLDTVENHWLLIHCDDEYYREKYQKYKIVTKDFLYSQRWGGKEKDHSKASVNHLYISNF